MSILLKGIKNGLGQYTGIGEMTPDEVAELTGDLKFADGTVQTTAYDPATVTAGVSTVFGRAGDVLALPGDYTATQIVNTPAGGITAVDVQAALNELDTKKVSATDVAGAYQPLDADLTAIAGLAGTAGLLRKTAADTWELDTTPPVTDAGVTTFNTRTGDVMPLANDYDASQITLDPTNIAGVTATDVQTGLEEMSGLITSLQSGLDFKGLLAFNDPDPATPPATGASHYYIFKDEGTRTVGDAAGVQVLVGDWLAYSRTTSKWVHLDYSARTATAIGVEYDSTGNTVVTGSNVQTALDEVDAALVDIDTRLDSLEGSTAIDDHINATTGAHAATAIAYAPTRAKLAATEVQGAIDELALKAFPFFDTDGVSKPIQFI